MGAGIGTGVCCLSAGCPGIGGNGTGVIFGGAFSITLGSSCDGAGLSSTVTTVFAGAGALQCTQQQSRYAIDDVDSHIRCKANSWGVLKSFPLMGYPETQRCLDFSYSQYPLGKLTSHGFPSLVSLDPF